LDTVTARVRFYFGSAMSRKLEYQASDDESCISSEDTHTSTQVPDDVSEDLEWEDGQYESDADDDTEDVKPKESKVIVMWRKSPLKYRYLDEDGCLDRDHPWPVRKTTQHAGPLVRTICGSRKLKNIVDVVEEIEDISLPEFACMKAKRRHDDIVSL